MYYDAVRPWLTECFGRFNESERHAKGLLCTVGSPEEAGCDPREFWAHLQVFLQPRESIGIDIYAAA